MLAADPSQPARCVGADLLSGLYVNRDNTGGTGWGCRSTVDNRGVFPAPRRSLAWIIAKRGPGMVGTAIGGCAWRQRRVWPGCGPCFAVRRSANRTERICHSPHNCPTPRPAQRARNPMPDCQAAVPTAAKINIRAAWFSWRPRHQFIAAEAHYRRHKTQL